MFWAIGHHQHRQAKPPDGTAEGCFVPRVEEDLGVNDQGGKRTGAKLPETFGGRGGLGHRYAFQLEVQAQEAAHRRALVHHQHRGIHQAGVPPHGEGGRETGWQGA